MCDIADKIDALTVAVNFLSGLVFGVLAGVLIGAVAALVLDR